MEYQKSPFPVPEVPPGFLQPGYPGLFPFLTPQYYFVQTPQKTLYSQLDLYRNILTGASIRRGRSVFTPSYPYFKVDAAEFPGTYFWIF